MNNEFAESFKTLNNQTIKQELVGNIKLIRYVLNYCDWVQYKVAHKWLKHQN